MIMLALALSLAPAGDGSVWDRLAQCESGGNWSYNGPSGFDGGLQFSPSTWTAMGGPTQYAWQATRSQQIAVAQRLWEAQGWGAWPGCARALGLYGSNPTQDSSRVDAINDAPEGEPETLTGVEYIALAEAEQLEVPPEEAQIAPDEEEPADHAAEVDEPGDDEEAPALPITQ